MLLLFNLSIVYRTCSHVSSVFSANFDWKGRCKKMPDKKPLSEARKKANAKYLSKFAEMRIRLEPDYYEEIKRHAESMGESGAAFAKRAIAETMERDKRGE